MRKFLLPLVAALGAWFVVPRRRPRRLAPSDTARRPVVRVHVQLRHSLRAVPFLLLRDAVLLRLSGVRLRLLAVLLRWLRLRPA
jgi:hypothetical protein